LKLSSKQVKELFKAGKKVSCQTGLALFYKENSLSINRFGFVVPKKFVKLSTKRNRTRRMLREMCLLNKDKVKTGFDIIVYSYGLIKTLQEAEGLFSSLFSKAKLLR